MLLVDTNTSKEVLKKEHEIFSHPAWKGLLMGTECEELLRGKETFSYLLREGEARFHYYLSYVIEAPFMYKHQPFTLTLEDSKVGWGYRNGHGRWAATLEELIPLILHTLPEKCIPILK